MKTAVINIGNGSVTALAGGPLSLADLGDRTTKRVSSIEFSDKQQLWQVKDPAFAPDDYRHILAEFSDYNKALDWERDHFNQALAEGIAL